MENVLALNINAIVIAISTVSMEDMINAVYSYYLYRLRLHEDWDLAFRTYIFKSRFFLSQAENTCEGSGKRYVISLRKFNELKVYYLKDKLEQTAIAQILTDMDNEIVQLEKERDKYKELKAGMMQVLLTGKIRLI
jgi:type I restriction enzyme S subunit